MSIATLKRKTQAQYNNSSVGQPQFSLNGTRRSSGYVGQDMLGRSLVRSLSRNGALKGHGGCCGKYPTPQIITSPEMACLNDTKILKSSSLNTIGLLMSRYRWLRRPQPYSTTKPSSNLNNNDQGSYIDYLARKTLADSSGCHIIRTDVPKVCGCSTTNYNNLLKNIPHIVKSEEYTGSLNASEYIRRLDRKCTANDEYKIVKPTRGIPFGCGSSKGFVSLFPNRNVVLVPGIIDGNAGNM
jgi:hypothetical protein